MISKYTRYKELRDKAISKLTGHGGLVDQLTKAVGEISMMRQQDVPEHKWLEVQEIINSCSTHKATGQEGYYQASIEKMHYKDQLNLKTAIFNL